MAIKAGSIGWYLRRFRAMSLGEVLFRSVEYFMKRRLAGRFSSAGERPVTVFPSGDHPTVDLRPFKQYSFLGQRYPSAGLDWHTDFVSGKSFPMIRSRKIKMRAGGGPDAKIVWELNRLQFLTDYAILFRNLADTRLIESILYFIRSWNDRNPWMTGVNWFSNIEVNLSSNWATGRAACTVSLTSARRV